MALRIAGLSVPTPTDVVGTARAVLGWSAAATGVVAALPHRLDGLLDDVEALLVRVGGVLGRVEGLLAHTGTVVEGAERTLAQAGTVAAAAAELVERAGRVTADAARIVDGADAVTARADGVVDGAAAATAGASELLATYQPLAAKAAPLARRFVDELSPQEVDAAIRLVDELPLLAQHLQTDIMPILATLDRVGPDISELLEVTKEVRHAITGIPGFAFFRKRGADRADEDPDRPDSGH